MERSEFRHQQQLAILTKQVKLKVEKYTPHCKLKVVKAKVESGHVKITDVALVDAADLGFTVEMMLDVVLSLSSKDFYKSMTTHRNHQFWQDVYRPLTSLGRIYLKLMIVDDVLIVSFKEL